MTPPAPTQANARLWTALVMWASQLAKLMLAMHAVSHKPTACSVSAVHIRACKGIKNAHKSVTVQNRTHVRMNVLLRITHTIIFQSNADSSLITLYIGYALYLILYFTRNRIDLSNEIVYCCCVWHYYIYIYIYIYIGYTLYLILYFTRSRIDLSDEIVYYLLCLTVLYIYILYILDILYTSYYILHVIALTYHMR